jgi:hypothetical protein
MAEETRDHEVLTSAQCQTASELGWYRAWLLANGYELAEIRGETSDAG